MTADPPTAESRTASGRRALRRAEGGLFGLAALLLGVYAFGRAESAIYQAAQDRRLERVLREGPLAGPSRPQQGETPRPARADAPVEAPLPGRPPISPSAAAASRLPHEVIGRLEAPRLGLRTIVAEGLDDRTLRRAAGHVPGTALPGEAGNVAIAGHRDTAFRRLAGVRQGDRFRLVTPRGTYEYAVESLRVVEPDRVEVLAPTAEPTLTLVTCYPFRLVGPAPQRLVVRARQVTPAAGG